MTTKGESKQCCSRGIRQKFGTLLESGRLVISTNKLKSLENVCASSLPVNGLEVVELEIDKLNQKFLVRNGFTGQDVDP